MGLTVTGKPQKPPAAARGTAVPDEAGVVIKLLTEVWSSGSVLEMYSMSGILFTVSVSGASRASGCINAHYIVAFQHMNAVFEEGWQSRATGIVTSYFGFGHPAARELRLLLSTTDALVRSADGPACKVQGKIWNNATLEPYIFPLSFTLPTKTKRWMP